MSSPTNDIIKLLIEQTKLNNLKWEYLSDNSNLEKTVRSLLLTVYIIGGPLENKTFYTNYKNGFFVLVNTKEGIVLAVIPALEAHEQRLLNSTSMFQSELTRLTALALKQHPNVDDFLDEFMTEFKSSNDQ